MGEGEAEKAKRGRSESEFVKRNSQKQASPHLSKFNFSFRTGSAPGTCQKGVQKGGGRSGWNCSNFLGRDFFWCHKQRGKS